MPSRFLLAGVVVLSVLVLLLLMRVGPGTGAAAGSVLGRPLGSVWTSDGPPLQAFDTMVLSAVPASSGSPAVAPIELPPVLAKLGPRRRPRTGGGPGSAARWACPR